MQISLRSHLLAGTATVITASAMMVGGVGAPVLSRPAAAMPTFADVALTSFNPVLDVIDTIQKVNLYLFSIAEPPVTEFDRAGIIPDFLAAGAPIFTQYALNASDYLNQVGNYLFTDFTPPDLYPGAVRALAWAGQALPENTLIFAQQLISLNLVGALGTLQFAVVNPIQYAAYQLLNLGLYELGGFATRAAAVITAVAEWVPTTIRALADDVTVVFNSIGQNLARTLQTLQVAGPLYALAQLSQSLLGTNGNGGVSRYDPTIPDALINQTIGEGGFIQKSPNGVFPIDWVEAPSIRQNMIELRDALAEALATDVPVPEPPPFTVQGSFFNPLQSSIPTPWNPTPPTPPVPPLAATESAPGAPSVTATVTDARPDSADSKADVAVDVSAVRSDGQETGAAGGSAKASPSRAADVRAGRGDGDGAAKASDTGARKAAASR